MVLRVDVGCSRQSFLKTNARIYFLSPCRRTVVISSQRFTIANCLKVQVKKLYTQVMSYDRDLRLRTIEYVQEDYSLKKTAQYSK